MKQPKWDWRRVEVVVLLTALVVGNILLGMLDEWLEKRGPAEVWKGID